MSKAVFDSSALLALMQGEAGSERVEKLLERRDARSLISTVNLSEAQSKLMRSGMSDLEAWTILRDLDLEMVPFSADQARVAGALITQTRESGLSLGDRACLALALEEKCAVVTTDRAWKKLNIGVEVDLIRG